MNLAKVKTEQYVVIGRTKENGNIVFSIFLVATDIETSVRGAIYLLNTEILTQFCEESSTLFCIRKHSVH